MTNIKLVLLRRVVETGLNQYETALGAMITSWKKSDELTQKRNAAGIQLMKDVDSTVDAGFGGAIRVSESTISLINTSIKTFLVGLLGGIVLSCAFAYFISSRISRSLRSIIEKLKDSSVQVTESSN